MPHWETDLRRLEGSPRENKYLDGEGEGARRIYHARVTSVPIATSSDSPPSVLTDAPQPTTNSVPPQADFRIVRNGWRPCNRKIIPITTCQNRVQILPNQDDNDDAEVWLVQDPW